MPEDDDWTAARLRAIGDRVRAERRRQRLTQDEVWQAARVDRRTVQNIEAGREMKLTTLLRIAWVLDVPPADLLR
nr:helix-turn-helix transcriptional regulator [Streptomyces sp. SID8352]